MSEAPEEDQERSSELSLPGRGFSLTAGHTDGAIHCRMDALEGRRTGGPAEIVFSEFVGTPYQSPGTVHRCRNEDESLAVVSKWGPIWMEKRLSRPYDEPILKAEYSFYNSGPVMIRPAFGLRLQCPAALVNEWCIPSEGGLRSGSPATQNELRYIRPEKPWLVITLENRRVVVVFPKAVMDAAEISSEDGQFSLTPLIYYVGLLPGYEAGFSCLLHLDATNRDEWKTVSDALYSTSGPITPERKNDLEALESEEKPNPSSPVPQLNANQKLKAHSERTAATKDRRIDLLSRWAEGSLPSSDAADTLLK